jgi:SAM-dependent methyltransferase
VLRSSFHWTDPDRALGEAFRVLRPGGLFAAWWNRHDLSVPWYARHQQRLFAACGWAGHPAESLLAARLPEPPWQRQVATVEIPWSRRISLPDFARNLVTKSYVFALGDRAAGVLAAEVEQLRREHPHGFVDEPFATYAVMARN